MSVTRRLSNYDHQGSFFLPPPPVYNVLHFVEPKATKGLRTVMDMVAKMCFNA